MKTSLRHVVISVQMALYLSACGSTPPKPVLPDGSHRVPVNVALPVPVSPTGGRS